ncbi:phosphoglycerol transferase family alkaline phosphatase superfamily : Phosphoglycerol transferase family protein, alkaline phosphatase superfamily OS=Singulisphaera acidiphila (strain ATCC BAA-1392 / DSM 18658 / VKM B-2454 / MOB10) GN=Sinac_7128 PE=4 SV=1: DUF1501 [Gemmataceae bacterium]|nr:phosphoglycerol transferase family alkaline phosphatase superfamily : Phosphoglycerol transferase family protein, alkaline phosphatase superfamily OS=Singulisphaera acidiphila (strain ATCC BAA-1392 / DSM 18658 / VKM B-2454 / MOB10) GN=Sinac_7128 PE=4 SV=1: DUF1501 [Gemmataceae bacterium]VTU01870.1 phosphoglycerol transferase family alkaline phosphatase superfamily : Phosphoglycerol transferase family protein, alkaline phosphatase superfamily OS=Singulisphaera acidiphila (strain ATCC BAA-1392 / 
MLLIGEQRGRTCRGPHRRAVLQAGASSVLGLALPDLLRARAAGETVAPAKAVILLWLWGGPSQLDTFDPKPNAPLEFRGPFGTIPTRIPGVRFCELFPKLAGRSDTFSLVRTLVSQSNDHGIAGTIGLTGSGAGGTGLDGKPLPGSPRPALGSVVAKALASGGRKSPGSSPSSLHPFFVVGGKLHQGKKPIIGEGGGVLGAAWDPFRLEYDPASGTKVPALQLPKDLTPERMADRQALLAAFGKVEARAAEVHATGQLDAYRTRALAMLTSPSAAAAFDLSKEKPALADRYGRTRFGQSCLLARRLVESGVPFVQVNWSDHVEAEEDSGDGGWDHHYRNFQIMQDRHAAWLDQSVAVLLTDLKDRGLLDSTLVLAVGEFGREPKVNDKAGREHWPGCYSALLAGGGVKGGRVIGTSDAKAAHPADTPLTPADLNATVLQQVGLTSEQVTGLGLVPTGRAIDELL